MTGLEYSNLSDRPPGAVVSLLSRVVPGVRSVLAQVEPYAVQWEQANGVALRGGAPPWVALGDSMTQGIGASAFDAGWVGQLSRRMTADGWRHAVVNLGVNGARVADLLERQLPALDELLAQGRQVALVTVLIGSNDIVLRRHRAGVVERFDAMLDRLPPRSVVANLPNPHREARAIGRLLTARAARGEVVLADMRTDGPTSWRGRLASDRFHPNDLGYAGMAQVFAQALQRAGLPAPTTPASAPPAARR